MFTASNNTGKGIAKDVARMLVEKFSKANLMASTEVSDNPGNGEHIETIRLLSGRKDLEKRHFETIRLLSGRKDLEKRHSW